MIILHNPFMLESEARVNNLRMFISSDLNQMIDDINSLAKMFDDYEIRIDATLSFIQELQEALGDEFEMKGI